MSAFLRHFSSEMYTLTLKQSDLNKIYELVDGLINEIRSMNSTLIKGENGFNPLQVLDLTNGIVSSHFEKVDSHFKRTNLVVKDPLYVAPEEVGIGTRFELEREDKTAIPQRIQSTFAYVSIVATIESLFKRKEFSAVYFQHNSENQSDHICVDGVYERFCCGSLYKNTEFLRADKNRLQIQIGLDEFEPCNPLQSKAGSHKILAVYFII